jgi:hypothetical protein
LGGIQCPHRDKNTVQLIKLTISATRLTENDDLISDVVVDGFEASNICGRKAINYGERFMRSEESFTNGVKVYDRGAFCTGVEFNECQSYEENQ